MIKALPKERLLLRERFHVILQYDYLPSRILIELSTQVHFLLWYGE